MHHHRPSLPAGTVLLPMVFSLFLLLGLPFAVDAQNPSLFQELGVAYTAAGSENAELPSPTGIKVSSFWSFRRHWVARLSVHRLWDRVEKDGLVCIHYVPNVSCRTERTETTSTLAGIQGMLLRVVHRGSRDRLGLGGGVSFNQLDAKSIGESGRRADLLAPNTGHLGFLGHLSLALLPLPPVPLAVDVGLTSHWVWFHTCSGETPRQHDPFCKGTWFREVEVGLAYLF